MNEDQAAHARFLRGLSHELRTPLGSILILTELLEDGPGDLAPGQLDKVHKIRQAAAELRELVEHVSTLAKTVDGRIAPVCARIDLRELVTELGEEGSRRAGENGLAFDLEWQDGLADSFPTDRVILRQVLGHLLDQALAWTPKGRITLRAARGPADGEVAITVRDTGRGIPAALVPSAFEPFPAEGFRVRRPIGGDALSLPLAKSLGDLLRARLSLVSEEGRGSTVTLVLPPGEPG